MAKKLIFPDIFSWLSESLIEYFKNLKNEFLFSLFDALYEYTSYHINQCAYFEEERDNLVLYPQLEYDKEKNIATLKKLFFLSRKAYNIIIFDSLKELNEVKDEKKQHKFNFKLLKKESKKENKADELNAVILNNNMEPAMARELLLKTSYERNELKKSLVLKNIDNMVNYSNVGMGIIIFDLSFLKNSGFFEVQRYSSFKNMIKPDFMEEIVVDFQFNVPEVPEQLKEEQLISTDLYC